MTLILAVMVMMIVVALAVDKPSNMGSLGHVCENKDLVSGSWEGRSSFVAT